MKTIKRRRRREGKTNYSKRLGMLKGDKLRLVVRISNKYATIQNIESKEAQDIVVLGVNSKDLLSYGWPKKYAGGLKSLTACYLTGYLLGKKSKNKEAILDIGLKRNVKGSRSYAVLKGLLDAGMKINHKKEILPSDERINTNKVDINKIKSNIENEKK